MAGEEPAAAEALEPQERPEPVPAASQQPAVAQPAALEAQSAQPARYRIEYAGQQLDLTVDELAQLARIGAQTLQAQPQPQIQAQQPQPQQVAQPAPAIDRESARALAKSLMYGDEEASIDAISKFVEQVARPQVPMEVIAQNAALQAARAIKMEQDIKTVGNEYQDIFKDSNLTLIARNRLLQLHQHYGSLQQSKPELELYREACQFVRENYGRPVSQPTVEAPKSSPPVQASSRTERKRAAPSIVSGASVAASAISTEPRMPTGSEIVERMRKARHQPSMR